MPLHEPPGQVRARIVILLLASAVLASVGGCTVHRRSHWARRSPESDRAAVCQADVAGCRARCEAGDGAMCNMLGVQLELGVSGTVRASAAAQAYTRGCNAEFAPSCANLGWLVLRGTGVPADPPLAMVLFQRAYDGYAHACVMGHGPSCVAAVETLDMIDTPDADAERVASTLLARACALGETDACRASDER